jgi:SRSO17 transposase
MIAHRSAGFEAFVSRFAGRCPRLESRRRMASYLRGLLSETERKNGWTLAETAGDAGPEGIQRLLNFYAWDTDGVRDDVRDTVVEYLGDGCNAVLVVGDNPFPKKGTKSAGVARQYSSTAGRIENCQIGVFLAYASTRGQALVDRELYLPKEWLADRQRCREAGIGDDVTFGTRQALAQRMINRALRARVPFTWVTAGGTYGRDGNLRRWLEARDIPHVLAVSTTALVVSMELTRVCAQQVIDELDDSAWTRLSSDTDTDWPASYEWAKAEIRPVRRAGRGHWLLARRNISGGREIGYYICFGPAQTTLEDLVRVAAHRWTIDECLQTAKTETGLDHYQVRGYQAWYRHITLSMAAAAFLVLIRAPVV